MHVLMVSTFPPRRCGIGDYTADLARALVASPSVDVTVLTYADRLLDTEDVDGAFVVDRRLGWARTPRRLASVLRELEPDIVHIQSATFLHPLRVNAVLARSLSSCPVVTTVHDTPSTWRTSYTIPPLRGVYRNSSLLLVHSTGVAHTLTCFHGMAPEKIVRISHGVDTETYRPDADQTEARMAYGLEGRRMVIFFGFLRRGKGVETLLRAWRRIAKYHTDAVLVIAGGTPTAARRYRFLFKDETELPSAFQHSARQLGIGGRVLFLGYVPGRLVPGLLASADVVVLPYDANPSQSGPLAKALGSGRPVLATRVPAFEAILEHRRNAFIVPPDDEVALTDALRLLLFEADLSRELAAGARRLAVEQLSWPGVAMATRQLYARVGVS